MAASKGEVNHDVALAWLLEELASHLIILGVLKRLLEQLSLDVFVEGGGGIIVLFDLDPDLVVELLSILLDSLVLVLSRPQVPPFLVS